MIMRDSELHLAGAKSSGDFQTAYSLFQKGEYDEAIALYEQGLKSNPDKTAYYDLGLVYQAKDDVVKAAQSVTEAIKIDKLYHEAFALLGDLYRSKRQGFPAIELLVVRKAGCVHRSVWPGLLSQKVSSKWGTRIRTQPDDIAPPTFTSMQLSSPLQA